MEMITSPSIDIEKQLKEQLQGLCDGKGQEIDACKSAPILCQLGKIYHLRAKQSSHSDCMINFIQSAALYNAAIVS